MFSRGITVRRIGARATAAAALVVAATAVSGQTAHAVGGATIDVTAICAGDGSPSGYATLTDSFSDLPTNPPYAFQVVGNRDVNGGSDTWEGESGNADAGTFSESTTVQLFVTSVDTDILPGQQYHWTLYKTYGTTTVQAEGDVVVGGSCFKHEKPKPPKFGPSPHKITVDKKGRFSYVFKATPALTGTVTVSKKSATWATKNFLVPDEGTVTAKLKLTHKALKALKQAGKATTDVAVKLVDGTYQTTKHNDLILVAP